MTKRTISAQREPIALACAAAITGVSLVLHLGQATADIYSHSSLTTRALGQVVLGILPMCAAALIYCLQGDGGDARNRPLWVAASCPPRPSCSSLWSAYRPTNGSQRGARQMSDP